MHSLEQSERLPTLYPPPSPESFLQISLQNRGGDVVEEKIKGGIEELTVPVLKMTQRSSFFIPEKGIETGSARLERIYQGPLLPRGVSDARVVLPSASETNAALA
jgi:hypothetical protein